MNSHLWRSIFLLLTIVSSFFAADTLTFRQALDIALSSNLTHGSQMKKAQSAFYDQQANKSRLYPRIDLGMNLPSISYAESDVYVYVDSDPLRNWKKKYGFNGFVRIVQPTIWGGSFMVAPNISVYAERYKIYNPRDLTRQEILFSLRQPLLSDNDAQLDLKKSSKKRELAEIELEIRRLNLLIDIIGAYMNLYTEERNIERVKLHANLARDFMLNIIDREENGEVDTDWMHTSTARSLNAIADSISSENRLRLRREQITNLLNIPYDSLFHTKEPSIAPIELDDSTLIALFIANSPDIMKQQILFEQQKLEYEELRLKKKSNVFLNANYSLGGQGLDIHEAMDDFGESEYSLSLSTNWPLVDFGKASIELDSKQKLIEEQELKLAAKIRMIEAEARIQVDKLNMFKKKYEIQAQIAKSSENALQIVKDNYTEGDADLGSLIDAFSQFKASVEKALSVKAEYYKTVVRIKAICRIPLDSNGL